MGEYQGFLSGNLSLDLAILGWFLAQVIKVLLELCLRGKSSLETMFGSGGMPSSHSAFVCALAVSIGILYGVRSPMFALAAGFAAVVMYDAFNVRRAAGQHAKHLNELMQALIKKGITLDSGFQLLKESLGHTPFQVLMGALLGCGVGCLSLLRK